MFDKELSRQIDWLLKRIEEGGEDEEELRKILELSEEQVPEEDEE